MSTHKKLICKTCGYLGKPRRQVKGNFLIELVLWFFFIIPGVIYSLWRLTTKQWVCPKCGNPSMIPAETPVGQKLINKHRHLLDNTENDLSNISDTSSNSKTIFYIILAASLIIVLLSFLQ